MNLPDPSRALALNILLREMMACGRSDADLIYAGERERDGYPWPMQAEMSLVARCASEKPIRLRR
jgi:hypothetical protein